MTQAGAAQPPSPGKRRLIFGGSIKRRRSRRVAPALLLAFVVGRRQRVAPEILFRPFALRRVAFRGPLEGGVVRLAALALALLGSRHAGTLSLPCAGVAELVDAAGLGPAGPQAL